MSDIYEIKCIDTTKQYDPHNRITRIGGVVNGKSWSLSQEEAIKRIEAGKNKFWLDVGGVSFWIVVSTSSSGNKYIKSNVDREHPATLLSFPQC
jgi:hypothetical protein